MASTSNLRYNIHGLTEHTDQCLMSSSTSHLAQKIEILFFTIDPRFCNKLINKFFSRLLMRFTDKICKLEVFSNF